MEKIIIAMLNELQKEKKLLAEQFKKKTKKISKTTEKILEIKDLLNVNEEMEFVVFIEQTPKERYDKCVQRSYKGKDIWSALNTALSNEIESINKIKAKNIEVMVFFANNPKMAMTIPTKFWIQNFSSLKSHVELDYRLKK